MMCKDSREFVVKWHDKIILTIIFILIQWINIVLIYKTRNYQDLIHTQDSHDPDSHAFDDELPSL